MKIEDYLKNIKDSNVSYYLYVRENLKPNDYVKLNTGEITRSMNVSPINGNKIYYANGDDCWFDVSAVRNFSQNIIDLIEVGDYVNGSKVVRIEVHNEELYVYVQETEYCNACDEEENIYYKEDTIKSIVTKEQFSQMEYRIGE